MLSSTEKVSSRSKSWNTKPRLLRRKALISRSEMADISCPSSLTVPPVGLSSAARMLRSVVLPLPLSPMMATYSPCSTLKVTLLSACTCAPPKRVVYIFLRDVTSSNDMVLPPILILHSYDNAAPERPP